MTLSMPFESIACLLLLILLLVVIIGLLTCKPWRFLFPLSHRDDFFKDDLDRPFISNNLNRDLRPADELSSSLIHCCSENEGHLTPLKENIYNSNDRRLPAESGINQVTSLLIDVISDSSKDFVDRHTLTSPPTVKHPLETHIYARKDVSDFLPNVTDYGSCLPIIENEGSCLTLEVISGPSSGLHLSLFSSNGSQLPATLGRVSPCDLLLKDAEVSGKHALVNWNLNKLTWELTDMGSLNGTYLNTQAVHHPDPGYRCWGNPIELSNGDIVSLGPTSKLLVHIVQSPKQKIPFDVGLASDPMTLRRGGKKLPMEDVSYCLWPFLNAKEFGLFCIFDGHGGAEAAKTASKTLPRVMANILSASDKRENVISSCDASEILRDAFSQTEAAMNHQYEGCTATVLLVWVHQCKDFFAQCANVGDSACIMNIGEKHLTMTEDHRVSSPSEKARIRSAGRLIDDSEDRLFGVNIARMLGDKFLKEHESCFSSEPYISPTVHIPGGSKSFALMASDGLWDVVSARKAKQLVLQARARLSSAQGNLADKVADFVLNAARNLHTRDNTSVIFLDFDCQNCSPNSV